MGILAEECFSASGSPQGWGRLWLPPYFEDSCLFFKQVENMKLRIIISSKCLHVFKITCLVPKQNCNTMYNFWWGPEIYIFNKCLTWFWYTPTFEKHALNSTKRRKQSKWSRLPLSGKTNPLASLWHVYVTAICIVFPSKWSRAGLTLKGSK